MSKTSKTSGKTLGDPDAERAAADHDLDEALEESFPASDPPANTRTSTGAPDHAVAKATGSGKARTVEKE